MFACFTVRTGTSSVLAIVRIPLRSIPSFWEQFLEGSMRGPRRAPSRHIWIHFTDLAARQLKVHPNSNAAQRAISFETAAMSRDVAIKILSARWGIQSNDLIQAIEQTFKDPLLRDELAKYLWQGGNLCRSRRRFPCFASANANICNRISIWCSAPWRRVMSEPIVAVEQKRWS